MITISMLKKFVLNHPGFNTEKMRAAITKLELEYKDGILTTDKVTEVLGTEGAGTLFNLISGDPRLIDLSYLELIKYTISYPPYDLIII